MEYGHYSNSIYLLKWSNGQVNTELVISYRNNSLETCDLKRYINVLIFNLTYTLNKS